MKSRSLGLLITTIVLIALNYLLLPTVLTWQFGEEVYAVVNELPENCFVRDSKGRLTGSSMTVVHENHSYSVSISNEECEDGTYSVGDLITMKYFSPLNHLQSPEPIFGIFSALILFVAVVYYLYIVINAFSKKEEKQV